MVTQCVTHAARRCETFQRRVKRNCLNSFRTEQSTDKALSVLPLLPLCPRHCCAGGAAQEGVEVTHGLWFDTEPRRCVASLAALSLGAVLAFRCRLHADAVVVCDACTNLPATLSMPCHWPWFRHTEFAAMYIIRAGAVKQQTSIEDAMHAARAAPAIFHCGRTSHHLEAAALASTRAS